MSMRGVKKPGAKTTTRGRARLLRNRCRRAQARVADFPKVVAVRIVLSARKRVEGFRPHRNPH